MNRRKIAAIILGSTLLIGLVACSQSSGAQDSNQQQASASQPAQDSIVYASPELDSPELVVPTNTGKEEFLPLEVKEYGYSIHKGEYLYCVVALHNPNTSYCVKFPAFRLTARDADGLILGSEEHALPIIYPQQDFYYAGYSFKVADTPETIEVEVLDPDDYNIFNAALAEHPEYKPLTAFNTVVRDDRVMGEICNDNDFDIDQGIVTVVFKDENGEIVSGDSTFIDKISASNSTPFDLSVNVDLITDSYEVYANIW